MTTKTVCMSKVSLPVHTVPVRPSRFLCLSRTLLLSLAALCAARASPGAEPSFQSVRFVHAAEKQPLQDLLRAFASSQNWNIIASSAIEGTVSARFSMPPRAFWQMLVSGQNLVWYYDGMAVYVYTAQEQRTEWLTMSPLAFERLRDALARLDLADPRYPLRYDPRLGVALVAGPPRWVELAHSTWSHLDANEMRANMVTRIFPLRSAMAADQTLRIGSQDVRSEGVASQLRRLMLRADGESGAPTEAAAGRTDTPGPAAAARAGSGPRAPGVDLGQPMPAPDQQSLDGRPLAKDRGKPRTAGQESALKPLNQASALPMLKASVTGGGGRMPDWRVIEPDAAGNAVIVRDLANRMPAYAQLIQQLDRRRPLTEIEARMIEIERGDLAELGIDWSAHSRQGSVEVNNGAGRAAASDGLQIVTTLLDNAVTRLLARVRALESSGRARVVMSPRVLTLDQTEATLENTETAYVRVSGNLEANLFAVQAGSLLRVQPALLEADGQRRVRLALTIEDGALSGSRVDNVPVVQRHRIATQSEVVDGATLLVGGLSDVRERQSNQGVPGLSKVPFLGGLFSMRSSAQSGRDRFYLITPRVVDAARNDAAPTAPEHEPMP